MDDTNYSPLDGSSSDCIQVSQMWVGELYTFEDVAEQLHLRTMKNVNDSSDRQRHGYVNDYLNVTMVHGLEAENEEIEDDLVGDAVNNDDHENEVTEVDLVGGVVNNNDEYDVISVMADKVDSIPEHEVSEIDNCDKLIYGGANDNEINSQNSEEQVR